MDFIILNCPDCEGGGKEIEYYHSWPGRINKVKLNIDCNRCGGLGKLRIKESKIKTEISEPPEPPGLFN